MAVAVLNANGLAQESSKKSADNSNIAEVVAEGAGMTPDEALKDAFRNAVRQVVGAVVDADTLVKNDEIIDDEILTYSNGFVKKFTEVPGSKRQQGGLHRIKIKAEVERRNLIAKLKVAKVTVKDVDGKSLFAEAVTSAEAEANATKLLAKSMSQMPKLLTTTVTGKPEYDRDKSEVVFDVELTVNAKEYRDFAAQLRATLQKISSARDTVTVKGAIPDARLRAAKSSTPGQSSVPVPPALLGPKIDKEQKHAWCLWVCASPPGTNGSMTWNGYVIDANIHDAVLPFMNRHYGHPSNYYGAALNDPPRVIPWIRQYAVQYSLPIGEARRPREDQSRTIIQTSFLDSETALVAEDEFELVCPPISPWMLLVIPRDRSKPSLSHSSGNGVLNAYVAPFGFQIIWNSSHDVFELRYAEKQTIQRRIKFGLDDLKRVESVKSRSLHVPDEPAAK